MTILQTEKSPRKLKRCRSAKRILRVEASKLVKTMPLAVTFKEEQRKMVFVNSYRFRVCRHLSTVTSYSVSRRQIDAAAVRPL